MEKKSIKIESETDLFLAIRENNIAGLDYLYNQYCGILYGFASKSIKSQQDVDEVITLTFAKVWVSVDAYLLQKTSFKVWLIRLLICTIKEFLDSKNIIYSYKADRFPDFCFELEKPTK